MCMYIVTMSKIWRTKDMKKLSFWTLVLVMVSSLVYSQSVGDFKTIVVKKGENLEKISGKYLKNQSFKSDLLRYNHITKSEIKPGITLKIPYSISKERAAKLKFFKGNVHKGDNSSNWKIIRQVGTILLQSDKIRTDHNSKAEIQFDNGSLLRVLDNSVVSLNNYNRSNGGINVNLKKGSIFANVNKLRRGSQFKISTVTAVVGVRGTQFYVSIDENNKMKVEVYRGEVEVLAGKRSVSVKKGYETIIINGKTPMTPRPIQVERSINWSK